MEEESYKRIPGGEKTEKTGQRWSREELARVLDIYGDCRTSLHERNPIIQELGKELGRSTRSVEAQLQMYRALELRDKGEDYSHSNMNRLCQELWNERKG